MKQFAQSQKGVSLLETLVALLIASTTLIAILLLATKSYRAVTISKIQESGNGLGEKTMECLVANRGANNFSDAMGACDTFVGFDNYNAVLGEGEKTLKMNEAGTNEVLYKVYMGCVPSGDGQSVDVVVKAFEPDGVTPHKTIGNVDICMDYETVITSAGPGGLFGTCNGSATTSCY